MTTTMEKETKTMKRYAVYVNDQLIFNETNKEGQWITQKDSELDTVLAFERKYNCALVTKTFEDSGVTWKGYVIKTPPTRAKGATQ